MKRFLVLAALLLLIGCNDETTEVKDVADNSQQNNTDVATANDDASELPDDYDIGPELPLLIDYIDLWQSFESQLQYVEQYEGESNYYSEFNKEMQYVANGPQIYTASHSIAGGNSVTEIYATQNEGWIREDIGEWEAIDNPSDFLKSPFPPIQYVLMSMVDAVSEQEVKEDDFIFHYDGKEGQKLYSMLLQTMFNIKNTSDVTVLSANAVMTFNPSLSYYKIEFGVEHVDYGPGFITLTQSFTNVDSLQQIEVPEGL